MNPYLLGIAIILPLCILSIVILWIFAHLINRKYLNSIFNEKNSVRSLIIDKNTNKVRFFNRNNMRNVRQITLDEFYVQFSKSDAVRLDEWLTALLRKTKKVSPYFEVEVNMNQSKKKYLSVLKVTNLDLEKRIIHIDSYLFLHLTTRTKHGYKIIDISLEEAIKKLKVTPSTRGMTYNFRFRFVNNINQEIEVNKLLFTQLKEIALVFAYPPTRYLIEITDHEFAIIDYRNSNYEAAIKFIHQILRTMRIFLEINSLLQNVQVSVGIVANKNFPSNAKKLILKAQEMSDLAYDKNTLIMTYNKNTLNNEEHASEIDQVIKDKRIEYTFSPIVEVRSARVTGYILNVGIKSSNIKNAIELYDHARRSDEKKKLLVAMSKDSLDLFSSLRTDNTTCLFRDLKFDDIPLFLSLVKRNSSKDARVVVCFYEYDVSYYSSKHDDFKNSIEKLKAKGISSCLKLSDKTLILDSKIYSQFDYFNITIDKEDMHRSSSSKLAYRIIAEKLLKYNRPIIVSNANGWSEVELLVRSGIEYISSNSIAPTSDVLNVVSSKNALKLKRMLD